LIRYRDAEERLGNLFPILDELYADLLGIKGCGIVLLKGALSQKELEAILIMYVCYNFNWWLNLIKNPDVSHYVTGMAIVLNFFLREKVIQDEKGYSWPDFAKLFICINELAHVLEYHLALGSYSEAKEFVQKYGSLDVFKHFSSQLAEVQKNL